MPTNNVIHISPDFFYVLDASISSTCRYHLLCSLQGAGFEWLLVHVLPEARYCSILAGLQPQTKVLDLRQVSLACRLILLSWLNWKKLQILLTCREKKLGLIKWLLVQVVISNKHMHKNMAKRCSISYRILNVFVIMNYVTSYS